MVSLIRLGSASCLAAILLTPAGMCKADVILMLSADAGSGTWEAFLRIDDPQNETLGLAGIEFDVIGSGGLMVASSTVQLPVATESRDFQTFFQKGFFNFRSDGVAGQGIRAAQDLFNSPSSEGTGNNSILEGVGKLGFVESNGIIPATPISSPVRVASGTFSGTAGSLQLIGDTTSTTLLPATLPAAGSPVATFSPSRVIGDSVTITAIPEPSLFAMLGGTFVAVAFIRRQRRNG